MLKECQRCKKGYSGKSEFCRPRHPVVRRRIKAAVVEVAERGASKVNFGGHRGRTYEDVFDSERGYVHWLLRVRPVGKAGVFAAYCRDRRAAEGYRMNSGEEEDLSEGPDDLRTVRLTI